MDRERLDAIVFSALAFTPRERQLVTEWQEEHPLPARREARTRPR
jgi:hypothetical protein